MSRILHISKYYYPYRGGTETVARACVKSLVDGNDQLVICFNDQKSCCEDVVDGVKVIRQGCITKLFSQGISLSYGKCLKRVFKEFGPDTVIFHYPNPFVAHFLLKYLPSGVTFVLYWHLDIVKQRFLSQFFVAQNKRLLERANKVISTSPIYVNDSPWLSKFKDKVTVIPNCIDKNELVCNDEVLKKAEIIKKENEGKIICFAVGRHTQYKGYKYLIRAAHMLDDRFRVFIAGKGEETTNLKNEARGDGKIVFLGFLQDSEKKAYLEAMDVFCFPSITKNEAFGVALAEGMYFGKPAVTFTIPGSGVNYVNVNGKTGIEVPNRDVEAYAKAITLLADDYELRMTMGASAKNRVTELFMYDTYKKNIIDLVRQ